MAAKHRIGIIGCGGIAHGKHMPALSKQPNVELAAFYDLSGQRAEAAARQYGTPDARHYTAVDELLADPSIQIVHVCTPNDTHASLSIAALEAGKHVMCEKPMARTGAEARSMAEAAKRAGRKLSVGFQNRYRPDSQYLKRLCEAGELGDIYYAKAHAVRRRAVPTWGDFLSGTSQGGGPLIDIGSHALDLTLWMMDNYEPKVVLGSAYHKLSGRERAANAWGAWDPAQFKVEDSAFGMVLMKNGATVAVESSWALNTLQLGEAKTTLCGTLGGADMLDGLRINGERHGRLFTNRVQLEPHELEYYDASRDDAAELEMRLWLEAIEQDKDPVVTPEQACVVTEIIEAIYESSRTGQAVYFSD